MRHINGPLLIAAGAGSGKTKVITHRIAHLISQGVKPENILAVTFTNKAAQEMRDRISKLLKWKLEIGSQKLDKKLDTKTFQLPTPKESLRDPTGHASNPVGVASRPYGACFQLPFVSTFHSLGVYILRQDGKKIGISRNFSILDESDSLKIIKECLKELNLDQSIFQPGRIRNFISHQKNNLVSLENFLESTAEYFEKTAGAVWEIYEKKIKECQALDFDDLIAKTIFLFKKEPGVLKKYQEKWRFIHIDEYQDTNRSQYVLSRLLSGENGNICAVGDGDQAIYGFRGADFTNILRFEKDWNKTKIIVLETNYRSTQNILEAANNAISRNKMRVPKDLRSASGEKGSQPILYAAENEINEGEFAAKTISELKRENPDSTSAVLIRTNFQSRIFEEVFLNYDLPYEIIGVKFFEREEIKNILAYLKYNFNENDFLSFGRIINAPPRGIGEKTLLKYFTPSSENGISAEKQKELKRLENFCDKIKRFSRSLAPSLLVKQIFAKSGYKNYLENSGEDGERRIENIKELVNVAKKYDGMPAPLGAEKLLEDSALMSEQDTLKNDKKAVKIITVHAAKGLEFDNVFVAGLEEGLFPYSSHNDSDKEGKLEEERRLFYVSLTRARKNVFLSWAIRRAIFGEIKINKPSRFLKEISGARA